MALDLLDIQEQLLREALEGMRNCPPDEIGSDKWVKQIKEIGAALAQVLDARTKQEKALRELGESVADHEIRELLSSYLASLPPVQYEALIQDVAARRSHHPAHAPG
jgi:hypothetical protein